MDADLQREIRRGITMEEHLLYLASPGTHCRHLLRNAAFPRGAGQRMVDELIRRLYLIAVPIIPDSLGSVCEYRITPQGKKRLCELRKERGETA